ncbi:MAG: BlaI/MecI/CopY family transcriptional regulator [Bryobacteraceae bacterium]|nr:BlaI/MecI/CopY family transcriptional regulator [Bryobacteraceae bacterium]
MSAPKLSRRERQIMDLVHRMGKATAAEIRDAMMDPPSYSAVRAQLRTLEDKGHLRHESQELRYIYSAVERPEKARQGALRHLVNTFFGGSPADAAMALLDEESTQLSPDDIARLQALIAAAKEGGR